MSEPKPVTKYDKWIDKKVAGKPLNARAFLRDTYYAGIRILATLSRSPADSLSISAYLGGEHGQLYRMYENLVKASADGDRFVYNFYHNLDEISRYVRKNSLYAEFCEYLSLLLRTRIRLTGGGDTTARDIVSVYAYLAMETTGYLTPSRYDPVPLLCGRAADGTPLYCDRYYPFVNEIRELVFDEQMAEIRKDHPVDLDEIVRKHAKTYSYGDIKSYRDMSRIQELDSFRKEQILNIAPYINEYTYDMVPDIMHIYENNTRALESVETHELDLDAVTGSLDAGDGALPANGIRYDFSYSPRIPAQNQLQSLVMKETSRAGRDVMLYKLRFSNHELCGYYDRGDRFFYSQFGNSGDARAQGIAETIRGVVLYLYSAAVTPDGDRMARDFGEHFRTAVNFEGKNRYPISVTPQSLGEEPVNAYPGRGEPG